MESPQLSIILRRIFMPKIALLLAMCLLICSCSPQQEKSFETETETESTTISETVVETSSESSAETTEIHNMAITETINEENKPEEFLTISDDGTKIINLNAVTREDRDYYDIYPCGGEIVCLPARNENEHCVYLIDISSGEVISRIDEYYRDVKIYPDGSYEPIKSDEETENEFACGDHIITRSEDYSLIDKNSGEMLVKSNITYTENGSPDWDRKDNVTVRFICAVDDHRFLYINIGFEWSEGFGIYDFETGTAVDFPETSDTSYLGMANGKIYAATNNDAYFIGYKLRIIDPDIMESRLLADYTDLEDIDGYAWYDVPKDGQPLRAFLLSGTTGSCLFFDPYNGEVLRENSFEIEEIESNHFRGQLFTDNYFCYCDGSRLYVRELLTEL